MSDSDKPFWYEWFGAPLLLGGFLLLAYVVGKYPEMMIRHGPWWLMVKSLLVSSPAFFGLWLFIHGSSIRAQERARLRGEQTARGDAELARLKTMYPPDRDVLFHLHRMGYQNVSLYIDLLEEKVRLLERQIHPSENGPGST